MTKQVTEVVSRRKFLQMGTFVLTGVVIAGVIAPAKIVEDVEVELIAGELLETDGFSMGVGIVEGVAEGLEPSATSDFRTTLWDENGSNAEIVNLEVSL